jgi:proteasome component ECM29
LDKLFFKILASDTDLDFEENLGIYLPKLVSKLSTNEELIRKKVMEILVHINKRVKNRPNVQLPIQEFLNQFNNPSNQNQSFVTVSKTLLQN